MCVVYDGLPVLYGSRAQRKWQSSTGFSGVKWSWDPRGTPTLVDGVRNGQWIGGGLAGLRGLKPLDPLDIGCGRYRRRSNMEVYSVRVGSIYDIDDSDNEVLGIRWICR
jgi:hypothetical protein